MYVTCPECSTRYVVDATAIGPAGRRVRCSRCGHVWAEPAPEDVPRLSRRPLAPDGDDFAPRARRRPDNLPALSQRRRSRLPLLLWLLFFALIGGLAAGAYLERDVIVAKWPAASRLYAYVGLGEPAAHEIFAVRDTTLKTVKQDGKTVLIAEGKLVNGSKHAQMMPAVEAVLLGKQRRELKRWTVDVPAVRLTPGEEYAFKTELKDPPAGAENFEIFLSRR